MATRQGYHHGDLAAALLNEGLRIVADQGPAALTAREVTQAVGVSSAALYRHYSDIEQLKAEVSRCARQQMAQRMSLAADRVTSPNDPHLAALNRFAAIGRAYITFAAEDPHLFQCAFMQTGSPPLRTDDPSAWDVLNAALDDLVATDALTPDLREQAPLIAWTSVHGLASLVAMDVLPPDGSIETVTGIVLRGIDRALGLPAD